MSNIIDSIQLSGITYQIEGSGGGKAIEAGRGISITTGETADTVSFNLPISGGSGINSIIEGESTTANGNYSHAEGYGTQANNLASHAEGYQTKASGYTSHAEGWASYATSEASHAEGESTTASGEKSHAEGYHTSASGYYSHAEGYYTIASGDSSHAEGIVTQANGQSSHAEGWSTIANNESEHASGQYNVSSSASTTFGDSGNTLFSVGNGTADNARHNAFEIRQNGDIYLSSGGTDIKLQDHLGGSSITVDSTLSPTSENPVQNQALYSELRIDNGETETTLTFEDSQSTNYPNGCTKLNVEVVGSGNYSSIDFFNDNDDNLGNIRIDNWVGIIVNNTFEGASYEISGTTVIITYPTVTVRKIVVTSYGNYVYKAIVSSVTPLKDQVAANTTALGSKQDTLVSGTNIKTINNTSILGSGNIDIQGGGGKAIEAGRGITITTGETADTVSFNLPISAGTGTNSIIEGDSTTANGFVAHAEGNGTTASGRSSHTEGNYTKASGQSSHAEGNWTTASGDYSHAEGSDTVASGMSSHAEGIKTKTRNQSEHASGQYNVSSNASTTFGNSGNTLFSVGNGTGINARHNAFEIRQNGDIYISSGNTDIKLQDHLGGGGSVTVDTELNSGSTNPVANSAITTALDDKQDTLVSSQNIKTINNQSLLGSGNIDIQGGSSYTAGDGIDITNDVISVTGKADTSAVTEVSNAFTAHTANTTVHTTAAEKTSWNGAVTDIATVSGQVSTNTTNIATVSAATTANTTALGGLSLVKLTQSEYDALATKDNSTLYVIVN